VVSEGLAGVLERERGDALGRYDEIAASARSRIRAIRFSAELMPVRLTDELFPRERWPQSFDRPRKRLSRDPVELGTKFGLDANDDVVAAWHWPPPSEGSFEWYRISATRAGHFSVEDGGVRRLRLDGCERDAEGRLCGWARYGNRYAWHEERYLRDGSGLVTRIDMSWTDLLNEEWGSDVPQRATQLLFYEHGRLARIEQRDSDGRERLVYQAGALSTRQALAALATTVERSVREHLEREPASAIALIYTSEDPYVSLTTAGPRALADGLDAALMNTADWPDAREIPASPEMIQAARALTHATGKELTTSKVRAAILPIATSLNHHPPAGSPPDFLAIATDIEQEDNDRNTPTMLTPAQHRRARRR
jgi:hypothetical protein